MSSYSFADKITTMTGLYQVERELRLAGINISSSSLEDNLYTVHFDSSLTQVQEETMNSIINNFEEIVDLLGKDMSTVLSVPQKIDQTCYTHVCSWSYPGYFNKRLECSKIYSSFSPFDSNSTYNIRLYDLKNNKVILQGTFSNIIDEFNTVMIEEDLLPTDSTIFEVHARVSTLGSELYINNISICNYF